MVPPPSNEDECHFNGYVVNCHHTSEGQVWLFPASIHRGAHRVTSNLKATSLSVTVAA